MTLFRSTEMVDSEASDFRKLDSVVHAWGDVINAHYLLPQLRGFWPFSSVDENGNVLDLSQQGRTLTNNGGLVFDASLLTPYGDFDGSNDYLSRADEAGLDITSHISFGGWFRFDAQVDCGLISKYDSAGNQRAYLLAHATGPNRLRYEFSRTGAADISYPIGDFAATGRWLHVVVTGNPDGPSWFSVGYVNGEAFTANFDGGGNTLANSSAALQVGAFSGAANFFNGQATLCFLCAATLSGAQISALFETTRPLFGV